MPKKFHNKLELMEEILNLGKCGEEITIYNITKKINQNIKKLNIENKKRYIGEQTISDAIKELKKINCLDIKSVEKSKTGKEKKIYIITKDSEKIFDTYVKNYHIIHKILKLLNNLDLNSRGDFNIIMFIISKLAENK
jgi:DNA-binding PadR family transcriptional regulator